VAEIFIITDMGGLQHFQMWVIFARAISGTGGQQL